MIAPDTDSAGALALAESLREIIAVHGAGDRNGEISVSVSIGISCCPAAATRELKDVLAEADAALYDAKQYRPQQGGLLRQGNGVTTEVKTPGCACPPRPAIWN